VYFVRVLGALLSAHLLMMDEEQPFGPLTPEWYNNELLELAHKLGTRLITAFDNSKLGIPHPRVHYRDVCFMFPKVVIGQLVCGCSC